MAPKKNPFFFFLDCHRSDAIDKGNKPLSYKHLADKLSPIWLVSYF